MHEVWYEKVGLDGRFEYVRFPFAACGAPGGGGGGGDTAAGGNAGIGNSRLKTVLDRGQLICGVDGGIPGFSFVENGAYSGLDVDTCKAVASALFDDPTKVEYRNLDSTERFEALKGGEVDMLARNTTWTLSRDTSVGMEFCTNGPFTTVKEC